MGRTALLAAAVAASALLSVPALGEAQTTTTPTTAPAPTTTVPTTTVPTTTVPPAEPAPAGELAIPVGDESEYRAALITLSAAVSGPNAIDLTSDIVVDDGTDPTYTGTRGLTIDGHGFSLDAVGTSRLLVVDPPSVAEVTLVDLTLRRGSADGAGGAVLVRRGLTVVNRSTFEGNEATGGGGAIAVPVSLTVAESTFTGNRAAGGDGGAIDATNNASSFDIADSLFEGNAAPNGIGGAVADYSGVGLSTSTFTGNRAQRGGGVASERFAVLENVTFTGNRATEQGGGLYREGGDVMAVIYGTLVGNQAPLGANLAHDGGRVQVLGTVLGAPVDGENCHVAPSSSGLDSYADDGSCGLGGSSVDGGGAVLLGRLQDNGGATPTMMPAADSPLVDAIDGGLDWPLAACGTYDDQRGIERPLDGDGEPTTSAPEGCDIGAVERDLPSPVGPVAAGPSFTG